MPARAMIVGPELDIRYMNQTGATRPAVGALEVMTDQTALRRTRDAPPGGDRDAGPECRTCLVR